MITFVPAHQMSEATLRSELVDGGKAIDRAYRAAKKADGLNTGSSWETMVYNHGYDIVKAMDSAVRLHHENGLKTQAFLKLAAKHGVHTMVETLVVSPRYQHLFDREVIAMAHDVLARVLRAGGPRGWDRAAAAAGHEPGDDWA